jgi:hypothetical protein
MEQLEQNMGYADGGDPLSFTADGLMRLRGVVGKYPKFEAEVPV